MNRLKNITIGFIIITIIIVAIDMFFKSMVTKNLEFGESIQIMGGLITITRVQTLRMYFGLQNGSIIIDTIKILIQLIFVIIFIRIQQVKVNKLIKYAITLIIFGWIGNYLDRIFFASGENHYLQLDYINISALFRFYINLSSIMTSIGWILFIVAIFAKSGDIKIILKKR